MIEANVQDRDMSDQYLSVPSSVSLIPILRAQSVVAMSQKPLVMVIVGGIVFATLLTLFVLPTLCGFFSHKILDQQTLEHL